MPCSRRRAVKRTGSRQLVLLQILGTACARVQEGLICRRRRKRLLHGGHPPSSPRMMRLPFHLLNSSPGQVRLDDLVDLYKRVFAHILGRAGAKVSPYSRYYIAVSTPDSWKHIMTAIGAVLARIGKLEDGTAHSVHISVVPPPCVRDARISVAALILMVAYHVFRVLFYARASLFFGASQNVRGQRAKDLGWEPRPVVLEDWADEGVTSAVATLK